VIVYLLCIVLIVLISLNISMTILSISFAVYFLMSKIIARVTLFFLSKKDESYYIIISKVQLLFLMPVVPPKKETETVGHPMPSVSLLKK
jgi:hypothetical protein